MSTRSPSVAAPKINLGFIPALVLIPIGLLLAGISLYFGFQQRASQSWPVVPGVVTNAYVEEYRDADQESSYKAKVIYRYIVADEVYASKQVSFGIVRSYTSQDRARQALQGYPIGGEVMVYYDPEDPTNAVLDRTTTRVPPFLWLGGGLVLLGLMTLAGVRRKRVNVG